METLNSGKLVFTAIPWDNAFIILGKEYSYQKRRSESGLFVFYYISDSSFLNPVVISEYYINQFAKIIN